MLHAAHQLLVLLYIALPVLALIFAWLRRRHGGVTRYITTAVCGMLLGIGLAVAFARIDSRSLRVDQTLLAGYFAISLLFLFIGIDAILRGLFAMLLRSSSGSPFWRAVRAQLASALRLMTLFAIGLPYALAVITTYQTKSSPMGGRRDQLGQFSFRFEPVSFAATDGTRLSGWWIPAKQRRSSSQTVIICHGQGGDKASHLVLAQNLVPGGYNVLIFDFRAHGDSEGQLTSFGDLERRDVLGAVRWLRATHARQAERIVGVGAGTGGAALIAAAADPSTEGRAIEAIAIYGGYSDFHLWAEQLAHDFFQEPARWMTVHVALPMASLQSGTDLNGFSPASFMSQIWPRPVLIIHGGDDSVTPWDHGFRLFRAASPPRDSYWLGKAGQGDVLRSRDVARYVKEFFDSARAYPVI